MKSNYHSKSTKPNPHNRFRTNQDIKTDRVRLLANDGTLIGVLNVQDALRIAELKNLDLVEIVPNSTPPVCKVIDFGKFLYEVQKKERERVQNQTQHTLKEIRFK